MILRSAGSSPSLRINRAFAEDFGLTSEDLAPGALLDWIHPDDKEALARQLDAGKGCAHARHQAKRGEWLAMEWRVRTHGGQAVALGLRCREPGVSTKLPEPGVPRQRVTLSETLAAMVRIVEARADGLRCSILLVDPEHEYVTVGAGPSLPAKYNEAVEGLRIGPAVGSCGTAVFWNVPVIVEDIAADPLWKDLRQAARIAGVASCWSVPITATSNGDVLGAMALYDTKPSAPTRHQMDMLAIAARMVGLAIERDRLEEQLRQASKMEAVGVLAGGIAHDFNNLLAAIMGNAELAMQVIGADAAARSNLRRIITASVTASVTATDLCNQLLTYAGRSTTTTEPLDCNTLVTEIGTLLKVALSKKVTLSFELQDAAMGVVADRSQVRQVMMNLIRNASEAIGSGAGRVVIGTGVRTIGHDAHEFHHSGAPLAPGEYVRVWVSDTGAGMSPTTRAKIFDPFFTTKPNGRGLGLAAVQGIVRSHGGAIAVQSTMGEGTTISLLLPRVDLPAEHPVAVPGSGTAASGICILVVDDEVSVRQVLAEMLKRAGYDVIEACDGQEAVDVFRREAETIDCVLLDLSMPKLNGEEASAQLRRIRPDVRVILSSGFTEQEILDQFQGAGLAEVVQKPAQLHVLLAKIARALR